MAAKDWKRYYIVVWETPFEAPMIFRDRIACYEYVGVALARHEGPRDILGTRWPKPLGVVGVRGRKGRHDVQRYLFERSHP